MALPSKKTKPKKSYLSLSYVIYGQPKSGKSTVASNFGGDEGNILFFATEAGHNFLEVYKWETKKGEQPTNWIHFKECAKELGTTDHSFKMLAIDTIDNLWDWCTDYVCKKEGIQHESDLGFGKGYSMIKKELKTVVDYLGQKEIGLLFISHAKTADKDLVNRKVSYTDMSLANSGKKFVTGLCDYIFYFYLDENGKRLIRTKGSETVNSGDRSGQLPAVIDMSAENLIKALNTGKE